MMKPLIFKVSVVVLVCSETFPLLSTLHPPSYSFAVASPDKNL